MILQYDNTFVCKGTSSMPKKFQNVLQNNTPRASLAKRDEVACSLNQKKRNPEHVTSNIIAYMFFVYVVSV